MKARKIALPTVLLVESPNTIISIGTTMTPPPIAVAPTRAPQITPNKTAKVL